MDKFNLCCCKVNFGGFLSWTSHIFKLASALASSALFSPPYSLYFHTSVLHFAETIAENIIPLTMGKFSQIYLQHLLCCHMHAYLYTNTCRRLWSSLIHHLANNASDYTLPPCTILGVFNKFSCYSSLLAFISTLSQKCAMTKVLLWKFSINWFI